MRKINFSAEEVADIQQIIQEVQDKLNAGDTVKTGEIRPTNLLPILMQGESGREAVPMRWGFPSSFKKGLDINAKAETVLDPRKHYWNKAKDQHCIIMSTGFYEWQEHEDKSKTQMLFRMPDNPVLYMAGFYRRFPEGDKVKDSYPRFVILTTDGTVNDTMKDIHSRMPVVLRPHECEGWLNSEADLAKLSDRSQLHMDCRPA